jgi:hypothetical protein
MQNLGLSQDYKDSDSEIGKWLKQALAHFLDPPEVEDCSSKSTWISFGCKLKFLSVQAAIKEFHIFLYTVSDFPDNKANTNGTKCPLRNL